MLLIMAVTRFCFVLAHRSKSLSNSCQNAPYPNSRFFLQMLKLLDSIAVNNTELLLISKNSFNPLVQSKPLQHCKLCLSCPPSICLFSKTLILPPVVNGIWGSPAQSLHCLCPPTHHTPHHMHCLLHMALNGYNGRKKR